MLTSTLMVDQQSLFGGEAESPKEALPKKPGISRSEDKGPVPLAERMRPRSLEEFLGQEKIIGAGTLLRKAVEKGALPSLIFWGPPASGKTSLALLLSKQTQSRFVTLSAVTSGVKDIREAVEQARQFRDHSGTGTVLFIDEIHRFNKSQQDALLPHVEKGLFTLIGATTENPSFEVIGALLSRCRVYVLEPLSVENIVALLELALKDPDRGYGKRSIEVEEGALASLADACHGDPRSALNSLQLAIEAHPEDPLILTESILMEALQKKALLYDKSGEEHFNLISAFHKSLRGSDPDAALYWLARMLAAGEDPLYVSRRMIRFASEDIGNADPQALPLSLAADQAYRTLGTPEGELAIAQIALYLATAPKSNAAYTAYKEAIDVAHDKGPLPTPLDIRNASTGLMKELGYGKQYQYDHDSKEGYLPQQYLPDEIDGTRFYHPVERGFEREIIKRLEYWRRLKEDHLKEKGTE